MPGTISVRPIVPQHTRSYFPRSSPSARVGMSRLRLSSEGFLLPETSLKGSGRGCSLPVSSEAAGVVSIARIERPLFHRGGSASTETMPAVSPSPSKLARFSSLRRTPHVGLRAAVERGPSQGARSGSTGPMWVSFHPFLCSASKKGHLALPLPPLIAT